LKTFASISLLSILAVTPRADAEFSAELIFPLQDKHVHASTIAEGPNGDLLAAWFHGSGERSADDVLIQGARLKKGATAWSPVFVMADTPDVPDCNPVLYVDAQDRVWLFWIVVHNNRWERSILKYRRADDFGHNGPPDWDWQDIILLKPGPEFSERIEKGLEELHADDGMWAEYALPYSELLADAAMDPVKRDIGWMTRTRPLALPSGRILLGLYSDGFNASLVAISDDLGETWRASEPMIGLGPIQPTLGRRKNGNIVALCRDSGRAPGRAMKSLSQDNGETWSLARDTDLPNPGSSLALITLRDGRWVLVYNDTEDGRYRLAAALSDDEGETWPHKRYLDADESGEGSYSYPTVIQTTDRRVHVTYSYRAKGGASIKHAAFDADWIAGE
jgi:predicted neuraminidase